MSSGFKYVHCPRGGKWRGIVTGPNGENYHTNCFDSPEDAARAVDQLIYKVRGPDALTNFPLAEQRARLDSITLEQLLAEFRAAGAAGRIFSSGRSRHRGVSWNVQSSKWQVHIRPPNGQNPMRIGDFADEDAAASAYDAAAWRLRGSDAKLNFPSKYMGLTPGQEPPAIETEIPDQSARDRLEAAASGSKGSASRGQKKRKPPLNNPVPRKKASVGAGTSSNVTSLDSHASDISTEDGDDDGFDSDSSEGGDGSSSEDLADSCHNSPPLAWLEDSAPDEGLQPGGQSDQERAINPIIFNSILQQLPLPNDYSCVSGMEIAEQVEISPAVNLAKPPQATEGLGMAATSAQKDKIAAGFGTVSKSNSPLPVASGNEADGQQQGEKEHSKEEREGGYACGAGMQHSSAPLEGLCEARPLEEGQLEAAQEAERFLRESLDPLGTSCAHASKAPTDACSTGTRFSDMPEHPNTSNRPQPFTDTIFPRSSDGAFHMAIADMQLRRMFLELGMLDEHGRMPDEDRPTHMLALRKELAAKSAAQAKVFEDLPPLYSAEGHLLQSLAHVRHQKDEELAELLLAQLALAERGMPLTIKPQDYIWVLDPEPGPGPLRPKGSPASNDHPAYVLHYLHQMSVPLEEEQVCKLEKWHF
ncbi:hypothetical protein DUNSADRAFT_11004 [Dunaliella salina]|uniref:AP2/ERF domain-containing protein n=1 Tax=Dunaliella salina TaxID=3046 RepID=A0ABQ7GEA0_DUNSA|nr:hypothetical protein DUNSADRAFT_11004 [Dunaliella salina]|eukprot:KAF5832924.1 hypothetical protein DUNSADRAFT_11004 [Dunaliella salina]